MNNCKNRINIELESFFVVIFLVLLQGTLKMRGNIYLTGANSNIFIVFTGMFYYSLRRIMKHEIADLKKDFKINSIAAVILTVWLLLMLWEGIEFTTKQGEIGSQLVIIAISCEFYLVYLAEVYQMWKKEKGN